MDFILSLTHFCEMHGPKSVLCTQVQPLECAKCLPPSPPLRSQTTSSTSETQFDEPSQKENIPSIPSLQKTDTANSLSSNFSAASTSVDSALEDPLADPPELQTPNNRTNEQFIRPKFTDAQGDMCASCSLAVPEEITKKLPNHAPGSLRADGKTTNGAPVLRSREVVCLGSDECPISTAEAHLSSSHASNPSSEIGSEPASFQSRGSDDSNCHDYILTYRTSRTPEDPDTFSALRASVIRTLSRELLPAGMSDGPLLFGDAANGYTIAYVFRLLDPKARGRRRLYAFVALAGNDAKRAFRACPLIWEAFSRMAKTIEAAASAQEERRQLDEEEKEIGSARNYTPVSSFLSHRAANADGNPRKAGQSPARSLAEIVGDDRIFSDIHSQFVSLLHHLGALYGGASLSETAVVCQTTVHEDGLNSRTTRPQTMHKDILRANMGDKLRDEDATPRPSLIGPSGSITINSSSSSKQCAPIPIDLAGQRQLVS